MRLCVDRNEVFVHLVPDLVYSPGVLSTCYKLHALTGRVVATFNARCAPKEDEPALSDDEMMEAGTSTREMLRFFLKHRTYYWHDNETSDIRAIPGNLKGYLLYTDPGRVIIFTNNPNPMLGKFQRSDITAFANKASLNNWDNDWKDQLVVQNRLLVQSNLDAGMSIEDAPRERRLSDTFSVKTIREQYDRAIRNTAGDDREMRREGKFSGVPGWCFIGSL